MHEVTLCSKESSNVQLQCAVSLECEAKNQSIGSVEWFKSVKQRVKGFTGIRGMHDVTICGKESSKVKWECPVITECEPCKVK